MANCPDCGCPVELKLMPGNSQPPMEIAYSYREGREVYHDMSECIYYLNGLIRHILLKVSPETPERKHKCDLFCGCGVCNCCVGYCDVPSSLLPTSNSGIPC